MSSNYDKKFEVALRFLCAKMPSADKLVKPTLLHSIRVGLSLFTLGYSKGITIAGLLHDLIEDASVSAEEINDIFGKEIAELVEVESKNPNIDGEIEKTDDLIQRCVIFGEDASIIKAVDIIDNLNYYKRLNEPQKLEKLKMMGNMLLEKIPSTYTDKIFETLRTEVISI